MAHSMISISVPDPTYMTWMEFINYMQEGLRGPTDLTTLEENWRGWATRAMNILPLNQLVLDEPELFDSWRGWAAMLAIATAGGV